MARTASDLTLKIRELLDKHDGNLTHSQIRPLLVEAGFEVKKEASEISPECSAFYEAGGDIRDNASVTKAFKACKFDETTQKRVLKEAQVRKEFKDESNFYNVTKSNWGKARDVAESRKPETSRNTKAKTAAVEADTVKVAAKRGRPPMVKPVDTVAHVAKRGRPPMVKHTDAIAQVASIGGVTAATKRIAALMAEAESLQNAVNEVQALQKRLKDAA